MVVGIGLDVVDVARFTRVLERTPRLRERLFTAAELAATELLPSGRPRSAPSLAARFAAKEALAKALGAPRGLRWQDAEVVCTEVGQPTLVVTGTVAAVAGAAGVRRWHLSLSHDGGLAVAMVVAES